MEKQKFSLSKPVRNQVPCTLRRRNDLRSKLVGLSRLLGVGVRNACEIIDNDQTIAQQLSAVEVADLFMPDHANGFNLKTQPPFSWCS